MDDGWSEGDGAAAGGSGAEHPLSPSAATLSVAAHRTKGDRRARVTVSSEAGQPPTALSRARADCLEICQPVGLGPATNTTFWLAAAPLRAVAVTLAVATAPFWSMLLIAKFSGK